MFYSDSILTKKGALAKVWMAAHMESKLTKVQFNSVDVVQSVKDILKVEEEPIALRVSGQLLLGVCRIYSRKAKYLLDDCNDALVTIKMQIRPVLVDLSEDQLAAPNNDLNMDEGDAFGLDLDWDLGIPDFHPTGNHVARAGDISLADAHFDMDFDGGGHNDFDVGPADGFQSQDFDLGFDLGLGEDEEQDPDETVSAVEFGRDAAPERAARLSMGSRFGVDGEKDMSVLGDRSGDLGGDMDVDFNQGEMDYQPMDDIDLGLDLGNNDPYADDGAGFDFGNDDGGVVPELDPAGERRESRESSRLATPPGDAAQSLHESTIANLTPRTAARVNTLAGKQSALANPSSSAVKKKKTVRVIIDVTTELSGDRNISACQSNRQNRDLSAILTPQRFIPSSRTVIRLLAIRADPVAHYLPTQMAAKGGEELLYAGPPGLGPELASMFLLPLGMLRRRREAGGEEEQARKKARLEAGEDEEVEAARRESRALSLGLGGSSRAGGDQDDLAFGGEDFMGGGGGDDLAFPMDDNDNFDMGDVQPWNDDVDGVQDELNDDGTPKAKKSRTRRSGAGRGEDSDEEDDEVLSNGNGMLDDVGADAYDENHNEGSIAGSMAPASGGGPLDIFDSRPRRADGGAASSQDDSQRSRRSGSRAGSARSGSVMAGGEEAASAAEEQGRVRHVSRNTARAMGVLRRELGEDKVVEVEEGAAAPAPVAPAAGEEKSVSFEKISEKTTRRAAAAFFFELLVLGTKDCLKLEQPEAYADISVKAKDRLWRGTGVAA